MNVNTPIILISDRATKVRDITETEEAIADRLILLKGLGVGEMKESVKETAEKEKAIPEGKGRKKGK